MPENMCVFMLDRMKIIFGGKCHPSCSYLISWLNILPQLPIDFPPFHATIFPMRPPHFHFLLQWFSFSFLFFFVSLSFAGYLFWPSFDTSRRAEEKHTPVCHRHEEICNKNSTANEKSSHIHEAKRGGAVGLLSFPLDCFSYRSYRSYRSTCQTMAKPPFSPSFHLGLLLVLGHI